MLSRTTWVCDRCGDWIIIEVSSFADREGFYVHCSCGGKFNLFFDEDTTLIVD